MSPSSPERGGIKRILLLAFLFLGVLVVAAPYLLAPWARGFLERKIEESVLGDARIEELSLGLGGTAHVGGFRLAAPDGRVIAAAETLDLRIALGKALRGTYDVGAELAGFELNLWRNADGRWNVEGLASGGAPSEEGRGPKTEDGPLPHVVADLRCRDGRVVVVGEGGRTVLHDLQALLQLEDLAQPAPLDVSFSVKDDAGPAGRVRLSGNVTAAAGGRRGVEGARGDLRLEVEAVRCAAFEPAATALAPITELAGELAGSMRLELAAGPVVRGGGELRLRDLVLRGTRPESDAIRFERVALRGDAASDEGGAGEQRLALELGPAIRVAYEGTTAPAPPAGDDAAADMEVDGTLTFEAGVAELVQLAQAWTAPREGVTLEGRLSGRSKLRARLRATGGATGEPDAPPVRRAELQSELRIEDLAGRGPEGDLDLGALSGSTLDLVAAVDFDADELVVSRLAAAAPFLDLDATARLTGIAAAARGEAATRPRLADSSLALRTELGDLADGLAGLVARGERKLGGELHVELRALEGDDGRLRLDGETRAERLDVAWPLADGTRLTLAEERLVVELDVALAPELDGGDVTLRLDSSLARGEIRGAVATVARAAEGGSGAAGADAPGIAAIELGDVRGELTYVPDRVGALLAPWLSGRLSGSEPEPVRFRLAGTVPADDPAKLLETGELSATIGVGRYETDVIDLAGELRVEARDGRSTLTGDLRANGGTLTVDGALPSLTGDETAPSTLRVAAQDVRASSRLSPLLSVLHPAFASIEGVKGGELDGVIRSQLELSYRGSLEALTAEGPPPWSLLDGVGSFAIEGAELRGAPLIQELSGALGLDLARSLDLKPIEFTIREGRLSYDRPWTWTVEGVAATFDGSIGLDKSLDLRLGVPITKELVQRHDFLRSLQGETIELPVTGTVTRPRVETQDLFADLAKKAAQGELERRLGLGGGGGQGANDPNALLREADELWSAGKKKEAAALYERIRDDFKISLVYALNKGKIDKRAKYRE